MVRLLYQNKKLQQLIDFTNYSLLFNFQIYSTIALIWNFIEISGFIYIFIYTQNFGFKFKF